MSRSPSAEVGLVLITISSDGKPIASDVHVVSVTIRKRLNAIPTAQVAFDDGDIAEGTFPASDSKVFEPGKTITIKAGYDSGQDTVFEGVIVKHGITIANKRSRLVLECCDKAVGMTIDRRNANYLDMKDSDIISKLIKNAGLEASVTATKPTFAALVQHYSTDWDFMLARAEANGLVVSVEAGEVCAEPPDTATAPELKVTYGEDLMEFEAAMDARTQLKSVSGVAWDPQAQAVVEDLASPAELNKQGNINSKTLADVVGPKSYRLQTAAELDKTAVRAWADARQVKAGLARIRGRMVFQGSAKAAPGTLIEVAGVGRRFEGKVFVSSVEHRLVGGEWTTEAEFGMSADWFTERADVVAPPASGWVPGVEGLQIGVVTKLEHPDKRPMVQVSVPVLQTESAGVWARLTKFYASDGSGSFFVPEIGDEVVLGYLANDPSCPVILGSLYSTKRRPPFDLTDTNFTKAIVTKSKLRIEFDDEKKKTTISTPAGNKVVLSDEDKSILLEDQNQNKVELGSDGITIESPKDISISAKGKIKIDAVGEVQTSSKADVTVKGLNINHEANVGLVAKGNATAELSASGQTTVKGAMVMIN